MITFGSHMQDYVSSECVTLNMEDVTEQEIASIITTEYSKHVFVYDKPSFYRITISEHTNQIHYTLCKEIADDKDIPTTVNLLEDYNHLILTEEQEVKGYLDPVIFAKSLYESYQYLQSYISTILETIDESCTVIDKDENVVAWTKGAEKIFSVNRDKILGKPITDFFHPERLKILNTLKNGTAVHHSQHKARENQVVLINSNPVYYNDNIIGAVVSETDITSQIKLNQELYHASEKLFHLEKEVKKLKSLEDPFNKIKGNSSTLNKTIRKIKKAASTDTNILIQGESGVGKELFAKAIHTIREGENAPFVAINCGAIPSALFESEIFGYVKGAFSGANQQGKKGKVELAKGGTLFLDEIGEMPLEMQVKILRLLQEKKFFPVGGTKEIEVDFRVVAATNRDLKELVQHEKFRDDLYYRLNVVSVDIPPLRKRPEDIIELTHYFLHEFSIKYNRPIHGISQTVMQALLQHKWEGNIRELKNVVERLVVFSEDGEMKLDDLPFETNVPHIQHHESPVVTGSEHHSLQERLHEVEKEMILKELNKVNGNKLACAQNLQITRATLYNRIKKLNITI